MEPIAILDETAADSAFSSILRQRFGGDFEFRAQRKSPRTILHNSQTLIAGLL